MIDELETSWVDPPSQSSADGVCLRAIKVAVIGVFLVEILNRWTFSKVFLVCLFLVVKHFSVFLPEFKNWFLNCFIFPSNSKSQDFGFTPLFLFFFSSMMISHTVLGRNPLFPRKSFKNIENEEETPILFFKNINVVNSFYVNLMFAMSQLFGQMCFHLQISASTCHRRGRNQTFFCELDKTSTFPSAFSDAILELTHRSGG